VQRGLAALATTGLVYDLLTLPPQLPAALRAIVDLPELAYGLRSLELSDCAELASVTHPGK